jgi:hypothetical protein
MQKAKEEAEKKAAEEALRIKLEEEHKAEEAKVRDIKTRIYRCQLLRIGN